jgi:hypothetical protein
MTPLASVLGVDLVTVLAFVLLVAGVVGSVLPGLPSALFSLAGVVLYWWGTGYTDPGTLVFASLVLVGLLTAAADWFAGAVAARFGGASTRTAAIAGLVGLVLLVFLGPLGILLGSAGTVFALEYLRHRDASASALAAGAYVVGFLASAAVQAVLTLSMLLTMIVVVLL